MNIKPYAIDANNNRIYHTTNTYFGMNAGLTDGSVAIADENGG
jgi:hypothetical protein